MSKFITTALTALVVLAGGTSFAPVDAEAKGTDRLFRRCAATGAGDISMSARWEERGTRKKFSVEFEAAPRGTFKAGQVLTFVVAGKPVGTDALVTVVGGDLQAEINFDTQARAGDDEVPFPAGFPTVGRGTVVGIRNGSAAVLSCTLN